ncbi:MAG: hypothetical protein OEX04_15235 [Acidimicrobiia bacterium]|nr:hypothetical protein [Acidimicrobiia bacterium]MDH4308819.1 hypothetical protein [Acidimicrobiia bacterium]MDH5294231.1 hypothetical protein [Acidimicrobiia bacterium]
MPTSAIVTAICFGLLLGWAMGREPENRAAATLASVVALAIGIVAWLAQGLTVAAGSLAFGGAAATIAMSGRWIRSR